MYGTFERKVVFRKLYSEIKIKFETPNKTAEVIPFSCGSTQKRASEGGCFYNFKKKIDRF